MLRAFSKQQDSSLPAFAKCQSGSDLRRSKHSKRFSQMRYETFAEFNRIAGGQMRPFGTLEVFQLGKIGIVNSGRARHFQKRVPGFFTRRITIFQFFQTAAVRKPDENNLATASTDFLDRGGCIVKAASDCFPNFCHEHFFWNVTRRRWRCEKRDPDLLNSFGEFASRLRAFFDHAGAPLAINRSEIRREPRWDERAWAIWNWQPLQQIGER